jgi:hypothetical protein
MVKIQIYDGNYCHVQPINCGPINPVNWPIHRLITTH